VHRAILTLVAIPLAGSRPKDGRNPNRLLKAQGIRIDPAVDRISDGRLRPSKGQMSYQCPIPNLAERLSMLAGRLRLVGGYNCQLGSGRVEMILLTSRGSAGG
jgi:hypothetical protein